MGWVASSVEKDFWVCWTLSQLFAMPDLAPHLTFLYVQVAAHRAVFFVQMWVDYATLSTGRLRLMPLPDQEAGWHQDCLAMRDERFSIEPPSFGAVLAAALLRKSSGNQG